MHTKPRIVIGDVPVVRYRRSPMRTVADARAEMRRCSDVIDRAQLTIREARRDMMAAEALIDSLPVYCDGEESCDS